MPFIWSEDIFVGTQSKAYHITELRTNVNIIRNLVSLPDYDWAADLPTDIKPVGDKILEDDVPYQPPPNPPPTPESDLLEIRYALDQAYDENYCHSDYTLFDSIAYPAFYGTVLYSHLVANLASNRVTVLSVDNVSFFASNDSAYCTAHDVSFCSNENTTHNDTYYSLDRSADNDTYNNSEDSNYNITHDSGYDVEDNADHAGGFYASVLSSEYVTYNSSWDSTVEATDNATYNSEDNSADNVSDYTTNNPSYDNGVNVEYYATYCAGEDSADLSSNYGTDNNSYDSIYNNAECGTHNVGDDSVVDLSNDVLVKSSNYISNLNNDDTTYCPTYDSGVFDNNYSFVYTGEDTTVQTLHYGANLLSNNSIDYSSECSVVNVSVQTGDHATYNGTVNSGHDSLAQGGV